jgi:hypothetical protein
MKYAKDVVGLEMRVWTFRIDKKELDGEPVEVLTLLASVENGPRFEVESLSKVLINHIRDMDFSDGAGKLTIIRRGKSKEGNDYYYFERGI